MPSDPPWKVSIKCPVCQGEGFGVTIFRLIIILTCEHCYYETTYVVANDLEDVTHIVKMESWPQSGQTTV